LKIGRGREPAKIERHHDKYSKNGKDPSHSGEIAKR